MVENMGFPLTVGYIQCRPALNDPKETMRGLDPLLDRAASADLLVLPELCNSGYHFQNPEEARQSAETVKDSRFLRFLQDKCRQHRYYLATGFNELEGDCLYNTAVLLGPEGYVGRYRKLHLFLNEKSFFQPGNSGLPVFDLGGYTVGLLVCFDWMFPEVWRILSLKGADVICHPSNLVLPGYAQQAIPVHALTGRVFVVTANRVGSEKELTFTGQSLIADPGGRVLARGSETEPELGLESVDLDQARDKMITARNHLVTDRRPEEYGFLIE
ncbi:MAG: hypothetical protein K9K79_11235 [Desulfohalobiaceae bacterium]|nr:hypothetical protein [Desulfohalobiaceae bacterium]